MAEPIQAATRWKTNGHMIADVAKLGYIKTSDLILDPTYGQGTWWSVFSPPYLNTSDINPESLAELTDDFCKLSWDDATFDVVAFDPPYKLNGTPSAPDERYGVAVPAKPKERWKLMVDGLIECERVLKRGGYLLVKCQDQVVSGKVWWQSHRLWNLGEAINLEMVDELIYLGGRAQPAGRRQVHARRNYSTLLIFRKR